MAKSLKSLSLTCLFAKDSRISLLTLLCSPPTQKVGEGSALSDVPHWLLAGSRIALVCE